MIIFLVIYIWGMFIQEKRGLRSSIYGMDQGSFMNYARNLKSTDYNFPYERARMPLYPTLLTFFFEEPISDEALAKIGRRLSMIIALIMLGIIFFIFTRHAGLFDSFVAASVIAFTAFVYKAPYVKPAPLVYGMGFLSFYLMVRLLLKPSYGTALMFGLCSGVSYWTKASELGSFYIYLMIFALLCGQLLLKRLFCDRNNLEKNKKITALLKKYILCISLYLICFFSVIFPYILDNKRIFGRYFYNVNSTLYIWYTSWQDVKRGTGQFWEDVSADKTSWPGSSVERWEWPRLMGMFIDKNFSAGKVDRWGWPTHVSADKMPTMKNYLANEDKEKIIKRPFIGMGRYFLMMLGVSVFGYRGYGYFYFVLLYGMVASMFMFSIFLRSALFFGILQYFKTLQVNRLPRIFLMMLTEKRLCLLMFIAAYFSGHFFMMSWFARVSMGNRFILSLLVPFIFVCLVGIDYAKRNKITFRFNKRAIDVNMVIFSALIFYLIFYFPRYITTMYGGG